MNDGPSACQFLLMQTFLWLNCWAFSCLRPIRPNILRRIFPTFVGLGFGFSLGPGPIVSVHGHLFCFGYIHIVFVIISNYFYFYFSRTKQTYLYMIFLFFIYIYDLIVRLKKKPYFNFKIFFQNIFLLFC